MTKGVDLILVGRSRRGIHKLSIKTSFGRKEDICCCVMTARLFVLFLLICFRDDGNGVASLMGGHNGRGVVENTVYEMMIDVKGSDVGDVTGLFDVVLDDFQFPDGPRGVVSAVDSAFGAVDNGATLDT